MRLKGLMKQEENSEGSSGFHGDRGQGTVAVLKNGWGQEPVWNRGGERQGKVASEPSQVL